MGVAKTEAHHSCWGWVVLPLNFGHGKLWTSIKSVQVIQLIGFS